MLFSWGVLYWDRTESYDEEAKLKRKIPETGYVPIDGQKVRRLRKERLMSMRDFCQAAGVALYTLQGIEQGFHVHGVQPATLKRIAAALFVPPQELIPKEEEKMIEEPEEKA